MNGPVDDMPQLGVAPKVEFCLKAAELHLMRAVSLAETEWKVSLAFWGVLLASGISFITYTNNSSPPMTVYIAHSDVLFLIPYLASAAIFVFGFSVNQAQSIVEERRRYRYFLNEAATAAGHEFRLPDADPCAPVRIGGENRVWAQKLLSTFLFVSGIWAASQWLAHGKLLIGAIAARSGHPPDLLHVAFPPSVVACVFFDCHDRGYYLLGDMPEVGTLLWAASALVVAFYFIRSMTRAIARRRAPHAIATSHLRPGQRRSRGWRFPSNRPASQTRW